MPPDPGYGPGNQVGQSSQSNGSMYAAYSPGSTTYPGSVQTHAEHSQFIFGPSGFPSLGTPLCARAGNWNWGNESNNQLSATDPPNFRAPGAEHVGSLVISGRLTQPAGHQNAATSIQRTSSAPLSLSAHVGSHVQPPGSSFRFTFRIEPEGWNAPAGPPVLQIEREPRVTPSLTTMRAFDHPLAFGTYYGGASGRTGDDIVHHIPLNQSPGAAIQPARQLPIQLVPGAQLQPSGGAVLSSQATPGGIQVSVTNPCNGPPPVTTAHGDNLFQVHTYPPEELPWTNNVMGTVYVRLPPMGRDELVEQFEAAGGPTFEQIWSHLPIIDAMEQHSHNRSTGLVCLSNLPHDFPRVNIYGLFPLNDHRIVRRGIVMKFPSIHIMMDRLTGRSGDCYIEFETPQDAVNAIGQIQTNSDERICVDGRLVQVKLSNHAEFLKAVFPNAKNVDWSEGDPRIVSPSTQTNEWTGDGFKGFITSEEMHMVSKFVAEPHRSRYAWKHVERAFESMITVLQMYPWSSVDNYTLAERDSIFNATLTAIKQLHVHIHRRLLPPHVQPMFLEELVNSALSCRGFTDRHRAVIIEAVVYGQILYVPTWLTPLAYGWPFVTLSRAENANENLVHYLAKLLREGLQEIDKSHGKHSTAHSIMQQPFGSFQIQWSDLSGLLTMKSAIEIECSQLRHALEAITSMRMAETRNQNNAASQTIGGRRGNNHHYHRHRRQGISAPYSSSRDDIPPSAPTSNLQNNSADAPSSSGHLRNNRTWRAIGTAGNAIPLGNSNRAMLSEGVDAVGRLN